jgi:hypothetical protein
VSECNCAHCRYKWVARGIDRTPARCPSCQRRDWNDKAAKRASVAVPRGGGGYSLLPTRAAAEKRIAAAKAEKATKRKRTRKAAGVAPRGKRRKAAA